MLAYLRTPGTKSNWMKLKPELMKTMPDRAKPVPHQVQAVAMRDCCQAISVAKNKYKATGQFQQVNFRSRKNPNQNIFIPKTSVSSKGAYPNKLGKLLTSEKIPEQGKCDSRLVLQSGRYYLDVSRKVEVTSGENQAGVVSLDPGLRTFLTAYSDRAAEKIGQAAFSRIIRLCHALDDLTSRREKASGARKRRMKKAQQRLRNRVHDLVNELHHKVAAYLTMNYETIVIPEFNFHPLAKKLRNKTVRGLATLAHGKFRQTLASHAAKRSCKVVNQNEAYTSKTCSCCGHIQQIGSSKEWKCRQCSTIWDRDIGGARGIFLRALVDTPWLRDSVACIPKTGVNGGTVRENVSGSGVHTSTAEDSITNNYFLKRPPEVT